MGRDAGSESLVNMKYILLLPFLLALANSEERAGFPGGDQPCYTNPSNGKDGGVCLQTDCCQGSYYISNLCPDYPAQVKCCYSSNSCGASCTAACSDSTAQTYACKILQLYEQGKIWLKPEHFDDRGNNPYDGASSLSNIRDTCYGHHAKRSSYCAEAPGGCVCLTSNMLIALYDYAVQFYNDHGVPIQVNALAGSCHSSTSWHYQGNTFDVACTTPLNHCSALTSFCRSRSPVELCYPGGPCAGHDTWVHCAL